MQDGHNSKALKNSVLFFKRNLLLTDSELNMNWGQQPKIRENGRVVYKFDWIPTIIVLFVNL